MSNTKRSAKGGGMVHKRADGRWEARYTVGFDEKTGKQVRKSIYGKTQKEVRMKLAQTTAEIDNGTYFEPAKMTVTEWVETWLEEYGGDKKYSTLKSYKAQYRTHIKPVFEKVPLGSLSPAMVQRFYNSLMHPKDGSKGLSPKSVRNVHGILSKACNEAVRNEYIRTNPCVKAVLPRVEKPHIVPLTNEQMGSFLSVAETDEVYGILLKVIVLTGLRESEAIGLTWDCVDFEKGTLDISKQLQKRPMRDGGFVFSSLKNDKVRILKPAPYVMELLRKRYEQQKRQSLAAFGVWEAWSSEAEHRKALVFTTLLGAHLHQQTVYNHCKSLVTKIGAPYVTVHDLRHTYAMLSLQNGDDVKTVQENLGHATAAFTLDVYGHISDKMKDASACRMEQYVQSLAIV